MANVIIGRGEWSDEASFASIGNERSAFPASNLQKRQVSQLWKSNGTGSLFFELDRGFPANWDTVAFLYTNATAAAWWRIRAADTQAALTDGTADYDSGKLTLWAESDMQSWNLRHAFHRASAVQTHRFIRVDIHDDDNDSDITSGRLLIGEFWQPSINMEYPLAFGPRDDARLQRGQGGALFADQRDAYNKATIRLNFLDEDEMLNNAFKIRRRGRADDIMIVLDPAESTHLAKQMIYGLLEQNQPITHPAFRIFSHVMTISELATIAHVEPGFQFDVDYVFSAMSTGDTALTDAITTTRASDRYYFDEDGVLQSAGNDTPVIDHEDDGSNGGLGCMPESENAIRNNTMVGAGASSDALPDHWITTTSGGPTITLDVTDVGVEDGMDYIELSVTAPAQAGAQRWDLVFEEDSAGKASPGETWTTSVYLKSVGTMSHNPFFRQVIRGGTLAIDSSPAFSITSSRERYSFTNTPDESSFDEVEPQLSFNIPDNEALDINFRVYLPQNEAQNFATPPIKTSGSFATRDGEANQLVDFTSTFNEAQGTVILGHVPVQEPGSETQEYFRFLSSASPAADRYVLQNTGSPRALVQESGNVVANLFAGNNPTANQKNNVGFAYAVDDVSFVVNDGTLVDDEDVAALPSNIDDFTLGSTNKINALGGRITRFRYAAVRPSDTILEELV